MTFLLLALIVLASVLLGVIVLIQNPKGGGLTGTIVGFNTQFMGVKQTTDVLEKGTWILAAVIGVLSILSVKFISGGSTVNIDKIENVGTTPIQQQAPANTAPLLPENETQQAAPQQQVPQQATPQNEEKK